MGDLPAGRAAESPIDGAHSVWELVLHIAAWAEIAHARLQGTPWRDPSNAEDFPPPTRGEVGAWSRDIARAVGAYESLAAAVEALSADALDELVIGQPYSRAEMLHGVVEHGVYHAGQIVLLRRCMAR